MDINKLRIARDIHAQSDSLSAVFQRQCEEGLDSLLEAATILRSGKRILITGMGASMFASIPLEYFLNMQGIDAVVVEAGELLHYRHEAFRDAVIVIVSRSGESIEIKKLTEIFKGRQPLIGVTNEPASLLAQQADVHLHVGSLVDEMVAIQTYTGTLLTLHLVAHAVIDALEAAKDEIEKLQPAFLRLLTASMDEVLGWDSFLEPELPVYLLGRGPSYASALEGALLLNEIAKAPAIGMAAASFRHGPVEVVEQGFKGMIFAPAGRTRELNLALARDLARFGGQVRVLGSSRQPMDGIEWVELPEVSETLAPLFEIVPIQVAALRMAQLREIEPGSFRYTPQVAMDEANFTLPDLRSNGIAQ